MNHGPELPQQTESTIHDAGETGDIEALDNNQKYIIELNEAYRLNQERLKEKYKALNAAPATSLDSGSTSDIEENLSGHDEAIVNGLYRINSAGLPIRPAASSEAFIAVAKDAGIGINNYFGNYDRNRDNSKHSSYVSQGAKNQRKNEVGDINARSASIVLSYVARDKAIAEGKPFEEAQEVGAQVYKQNELVDASGASSIGNSNEIGVDPSAIETEPGKPVVEAKPTDKDSKDGPEQSSSNTLLTHDMAEFLLSYTDVLEPPELQAALEYNKHNKSGQLYADELAALSKEYSRKSIMDIALELKAEFDRSVKRLNLSPSIYGTSLSWALWDIAKQHYFFTHPDKSSADYPIGDPMQEDAPIRQDIVARHLGWEFEQSMQSPTPQTLMLDKNIQDAAMEIITSGERNDTGQLRSYEYTRLGKLLINAFGNDLIFN